MIRTCWRLLIVPVTVFVVLTFTGLEISSSSQISEASEPITFIDDFNTYADKEDIMAVYDIVYTGAASEDSWTLDTDNSCIIVDLAAGDGIFWYLRGEVKRLNNEPGEVLVKGFGTGSGYTQLGVRVETEDGYFAYTTRRIREMGPRCDYGHGYVDSSIVEGSLRESAVPVLRAKGTTWEHRTVEYEDYWSSGAEHVFTMANKSTNRVGFWVVSPFSSATITIGLFQVDIALAGM